MVARTDHAAGDIIDAEEWNDLAGEVNGIPVLVETAVADSPGIAASAADAAAALTAAAAAVVTADAAQDRTELIPTDVQAALENNAVIVAAAANAATAATNARVAAEKLLAAVNGLDATGAADARAIIQAALNAATPGSTVYLPAKGTYKITSPGLLIPSDVTLDGQGSTLKALNSATAFVTVKFTDVSRARVQRVRFEGNATSKQAAVTFGGTTADCVVERCYFDANHAITILGGSTAAPVTNCGVIDCFIDGGASEGVEFIDSIGCYVERCRIRNLTFAGSCAVVLYARSSADPTYNTGYRVQGNLIQGCSHGVGVFGSKRAKVTDNEITASQRAGILIKSGLTAADVALRNLIRGNTIKNANLENVGLDGITNTSDHSVIVGNVVVDTAGGSGAGGAGISNSAVNCVVDGNLCIGNNTQGILDQSQAAGGRNTYVGNQAFDNSQIGVNSRDNINIQGPRCVVIGNSCADRQVPTRARTALLINGTATGCVVIGNDTGGSFSTAADIVQYGNGESLATIYRPLAVAQYQGVNPFTVAAGAALNGGAANRSAGSDVLGRAVYTVVAGAAAGVLFTVTYGKPVNAGTRVFLQTTDGRAVAAGLHVSASDANGFTVSCANAHAAGTSVVDFYLVG